MTPTLGAVEAARLRASLSAKLAGEARNRGVVADLVRKQYIFTIFLSRIFQNADAPWVLLGGNALLIRTGGGRFTQDVDLARSTAWDDVTAAENELRELVSRPFNDDPFEFELGTAVVHRELGDDGYGAETAKLKARALLGGQVFETFNIDLTTRRHVDAPVDQVQQRPIIDHATLQDLPTVPTTPIENHLADKICALYELHGPSGNTPSSRYRDLADIVRIVSDIAFEGGRLSLVLQRESDRRKMTLPARIESPGGQWEAEFPRAASGFAEYPPEYWPLDAALRFCGSCLDEVLAGSRTTGRWNPSAGRWM